MAENIKKRYASILERLSKMRRLRTFTPWHGGRNIMLSRLWDMLHRLDATELDDLDDLHNPRASLSSAQHCAAEMFGVRHTFFSTNGASAALMAAILSVGNRGTVLIPNIAHRCILAGLILSGARAIPYEHSWNGNLGMFEAPDTESFAQQLRTNENISACVLVAPTYEGFIGEELPFMVSLARERGLITIIDESHGAHLSLLGHPCLGVAAGADIVVHSGHKSLLALTQTGLLHLNSNAVKREHLAECLSLLQSTSPSTLLLASLAETLQRDKQLIKNIEDIMLAALDIRDELSSIEGLFVVPNDEPTHLLVGIYGLTGQELADSLLNDHSIECELMHERTVLLMLGAGILKRSHRRNLREALRCLAKLAKPSLSNHNIPAPPQYPRLFEDLRASFLNSDERMLNFVCPPGIPQIR